MALALSSASGSQQPKGQSLWAHLPKEILESVGLYLDAAGWRNGRLVCQAWAKSVTACIHLLEIDLERDAHRYGGAIRATGGGPWSSSCAPTAVGAARDAAAWEHACCPASTRMPDLDP